MQMTGITARYFIVMSSAASIKVIAGYIAIGNIYLFTCCGKLTRQNSLKGSTEIPPRWVVVGIANELYENVSVPRHYYGWNSCAAKLSNKRACGECVSIANFYIIIPATT